MKIAIIALVSAFSSAATSAAPLTYQFIETDQPSQLMVKVDTSALSSFEVMPPRSMGSSDFPQLRCHRGDSSNNVGYELRLAQCDSLSWPVTFAQNDALGLDVAEQSNRYSASQSWYFFSEWSSLPTIKTAQDTPKITVCLPSSITTESLNSRCMAMPSWSQAPFLVAWGLDVIRIDAPRFSFTLQSDVSQILDQQSQWLPTFKQQLNYLAQVFPPTDKIDWQLNVFGREMESGNVSGAAGFHSVNVNVPLMQGELVAASYPHMLKILAHEALHGMDHRSHPLWVREGLAEYYAQKSLKETPYSLPSASTQWDAIAERLPFAAVGLLDANRALDEENQQHFRMLFYTKAVAFWEQLDQQLMERGESLDNYVGMTLQGDRYELSAEFTQTMIVQIGKSQWEALSDSFL